MLLDNMNISRLIVYAQPIEKSKLKRRGRDSKRDRSEEQGKHRFKKRSPNQHSSSAPKAIQERFGGSHVAKPTCTTCGKRHYRKCLAGTSGRNGYGKYDHMVKYFPTLGARLKEAKKASHSGPNLDDQSNTHFNAL
ncbi:hypothetical protein EJD97_000584 [Solanum chilense]|uniref:Uncharacterized protein n=1 Tax=Solanum chilense TaxID=4083 RepID=A0A6N2C247_SOLCI|nr:hypothetical protein EJD97_000584 [Solanum chilense]